MGVHWKNLGAEEKQTFLAEASTLSAAYTAEIKAYDLKKTGGVASKPKRPLTAYQLHNRELRADLKKRNPEAKGKDMMRILALHWKGLTDEQKVPFQAEAAKLKEAHSKVKAAFSKVASASATTSSAPPSDAAKANAEPPTKKEKKKKRKQSDEKKKRKKKKKKKKKKKDASV